VAERAAGSNPPDIADQLNVEQVATAHGERVWRPSGVAAIVRSAERQPVGPLPMRYFRLTGDGVPAGPARWPCA
jgi:hypothetical protein